MDKTINALLADQLVSIVKFLRSDVGYRLDQDARSELARAVYHAADDLIQVVEMMRK